jgi:hypothetical protein
MNVVQLSMSAGKTLTAVLQSVRYGYNIIVPSEDYKLEILKLCESLRDSHSIGFPPLSEVPMIYTFSDVIRDKELLKDSIGVIIDDLDIILQDLLGIPSSNIIITTR